MSIPQQDLQSGSFGARLRGWRNLRRLSQLDLSLSANVSQRHLSWLETGRSQPSRAMVIQLAEALDVPLRERNQLLGAAGFAEVYQQRGLNESHMRSVSDALSRILDQQMPYPGLVVDREWNLVMTNRCLDLLLGAAGGDNLKNAALAPDGRLNIALMTLHPQGLRPLISNWSTAARAFVQRLRQDLAQTGDQELRQRLEQLIALAGEIPEPTVDTAPLLPMLTLDLNVGGAALKLFSVISTFGTPQDVTMDELRIESFFPADEVSDRLLRELCGES
ncbi:MAG: helix-turn-helix transcriptional regulator [Pseudomonadota bacterium]